MCRTVSASDGYGPAMTTSLDSESSAAETQGSGHVLASDLMTPLLVRPFGAATSLENTMAPCSVAQ